MPPVATSASLSTNEDTSLAVTLAGTDGNGDPLTFTVMITPAHGTLTGTPPNLTYNPAANYFGSDSFTFKVNDGLADSAAATISLTVNSVNDAPNAVPQTITMQEDTSRSITLLGNDLEGSPLTFSIVTGPSHGTLFPSAGTSATRQYFPTANYFGSDSFTFKVNDGTTDSVAVTVNILIMGINDAPSATSQSVNVVEDTATAITLAGADVEGSALTFTVLTMPGSGVLTGTAPNLTYAPNANVTGTDSFTFRVRDGSLNSLSATVSITITPVNDAPVANSQSATINRNSTNNPITLSGTDIEGSALTFAIGTPPAHGTLGGSGANRTYTPTAAYLGPDSFTFTANDGTVGSNTATVSITVVNGPPVYSNVPTSAACMPGTALSFTAAATDPDGEPLTFSLDVGNSTCPTSGISIGSGGVFSGTCPNIGVSCVLKVSVTDGTSTVKADYTLAANTRYVRPVAVGSGTGTSWANATASLNGAASSLGATLGQIWVAQGTYRQGTASTPAVTLLAGQRLLGGFVGTESSLAQRPNPLDASLTVINGDLNNDTMPDANDTSVGVRLAANTVVDGLEVRQLRPKEAVVSGFTITTNASGAIDCVASSTPFSATLNNVRVINNTGTSGAVSAINGCALVVNDSLFSGNTNNTATPVSPGVDTGQGGALYARNSDVTINRSVFVNNRTTRTAGGAGISGIRGGTLTFADSVAMMNTSNTSGAAIIWGTSATIRRSLFFRNAQTNNTGSINSAMIEAGPGSVIQDVRVFDLTQFAKLYGRMSAIRLFSPASETMTVTNVLISGTNAKCAGGGLEVNGPALTLVASNVTLTNNDFDAQNCAGDNLGRGAALLSQSGSIVTNNSVFYGNAPRTYDTWLGGGPVLTATYSCFPGATGATNVLLMSSPFAPSTTLNTTAFLDQLSGCVNSGDNATATAAFTAFGPSWTTYTTSPTLALDTGTVDMGYHADLAQPTIASFATTTTGYSWNVSSGFVSCQLYDESAQTFTPITTASGSVSKPSFQGQSYVLLCTSSKGPGTGSAVWSYVP